MRVLAEAGVRAGAVDQNEVCLRLMQLHRAGQLHVEDVLARRQGGGVDFRQFAEQRRWQFQPRFVQRCHAVGGIAREAALAQVEIEGMHAMAHPGQRGADVHGDGGLARPALFVSDDDDMCHVPFPGREGSRPPWAPRGLSFRIRDLGRGRQDLAGKENRFPGTCIMWASGGGRGAARLADLPLRQPSTGWPKRAMAAASRASVPQRIRRAPVAWRAAIAACTM